MHQISFNCVYAPLVQWSTHEGIKFVVIKRIAAVDLPTVHCGRKLFKTTDKFLLIK